MYVVVLMAAIVLALIAAAWSPVGAPEARLAERGRREEAEARIR